MNQFQGWVWGCRSEHCVDPWQPPCPLWPDHCRVSWACQEEAETEEKKESVRHSVGSAGAVRDRSLAQAPAGRLSKDIGEEPADPSVAAIAASLAPL